MKIFSFFGLCFMILRSTDAIEISQENAAENQKNEKSAALIFSQETQQLDEMEKEDEEKLCLSCLTACQASLSFDAETSFNSLLSITRKSLFLQKSYKKQASEADMDINICDKPFEPGMAYDVQTDSYEIGYELYIDQGKTKLRGSEYFPYNNLRKIIHNHVFNKAPYDNVLVKEYAKSTGKITTFRIDTYKPPRTLVFYWAPVLSIRFFKHQRLIKFKTDVVNKYQRIDKCEHYSIEDEWIKRQIENITARSSPPTFTKDHPESSCVENHDCLELTQIMPMIYLHTYASKLATCTHLNLAFIWESVSNGHLKEVDRYLFAVLRRWYSSIDIIFGLSGESDLQKEMTVPVQSSETHNEETSAESNSQNKDTTPGVSKEIRNERKLGVELAANIPIPKLVYRIVEYSLRNLIYRVLIIIHNERVSVPDQDRICLPKEEVAGWDRIKNNKFESGLTYACPVTQTTIEKLGGYAGTPPPYSGVFELNKFPQDKNTPPPLPANIVFVDETENVENEYKKLFSIPET